MARLKKCCVGIVAILLGFVLILQLDLVESQNKEIEDQFMKFIEKFNKTYKSKLEYIRRLAIFKNSLVEIQNLNSKRENNYSALYGLTKYSDMTTDEFMKSMLSEHLDDKIQVRKNNINKQRDSLIYKNRYKRVILNLPDKVDWRNKGIITDIKNQEDCGACWAFSVIGVVESMNALKKNRTENLSIQQMIDCTTYGNRGCSGGDMCTLLYWLTKNNINIQKEKDYPLHLRNEDCKMNRTYNGTVVDKFICQNFIGNEDIILRLLAKHGPVAVSINALNWQNYLGGVIQYHCSNSYKFLNHAVQIVGYDFTHEIPHYIVRNSWGKEFGDNGYLYIAIGENICGLANEVIAVTVM